MNGKSKKIRIPGYEVVRPLATGGMGTVYHAIQLSLQRPVALKIMRREFAETPEFTAQFLQEGRIVASLTHPGIVTIFDLGLENGFHYIALEYVDGGDLRERIDQGISLKQTLRIIRKLAFALHFAHRKGVVHRDVKPANILFREDTPLLTDFGIAKRVRLRDRPYRLALGSPHYISPEQALGRDLDGRSDIYSLGILFYEMLTGQVPYKGQDYDELVHQHIKAPLPTLPPETGYYQPLLERMLAKDPQQRIPNAAVLIRAIEQAQEALRAVEHNLAQAKSGAAETRRSPAEDEATLVLARTECFPRAGQTRRPSRRPRINRLALALGGLLAAAPLQPVSGPPSIGNNAVNPLTTIDTAVGAGTLGNR